MSTICISNLNVPGFDLLSDKDSYLNEISDDEFISTFGGGSPAVVTGALLLGAGVSALARKVHDHNKGILSPL